MAKQKQSATSETAERNIQAICRIEEDAMRRRSIGERLGDFVSRIAGTLAFVIVHFVWFGVWISINMGWFAIKPFDPFPCPLLTMVVSLEAIFLSLFILISQNRMAKVADDRSHLDLQINLLAELETTKILQMLQAICARLEMPEAKDPIVNELKSRTEPERLLHELQKRLPNGG
jgi:uncharacterized membrane protein